MSVFRKLVFIFIILVAQASAFGESESICKLSDQGVVSRTALHSYPSYFFGVFTDKNWVSFRGQDSNWVVDLDTAQKFVVPGDEDPVPLPGSNIITTPRPMRFFNLNDFKNGESTEAVLVDEDIKGVYQSIGTLPKSSDGSQNYRVLTDDNSVSYRDYKVFEKATGFQVVSITNSTKICGDLDLKTPKLSKDGKFLAAVDEKADPSRTKIYAINQDGSCTMTADLGRKTGKVDFSPDNKSIVFHIGNSMGTRGSFRLRPGNGDRLNVFEMRLSDQKLKQLTFNSANKNSYYPMYRADGKIIYLDQKIGAKGEEEFDFVVANPNLTPYAFPNNPNARDCSPWSPLRFLSQSWFEICANPGPDRTDLELKIGALDSRQCQELVDQTWNKMSKWQKFFLGKKELISVCPKGKKNARPERVGEKVSFDKPKSVAEIYSRRCAICHGDTFPLHDLAKLKENPSSNAQRSQHEEIIRRLKSDNESERMPRGMELDPTELQTLMSALL